MSTITDAPALAGRGPAHGRLARWAVGLSVLFGGAFVVSIVIVAIAYGLGVESTVEDTRAGRLLAITALVGFFGSLAAFVLAAIAKTKHERWSLLWLPLILFPAILGFLTLGELLWWE